ncbi:MAG TPA: MoaD/ThiS family protein [Thermoanaerobaculia bacterium]|nr:MoaD/ThiS family protein [Thermoanaerobaculia bacterium]
MSLTFVLPGPLRELTGDQGEVRAEGPAASLAEALLLLWEVCPAARDRVTTERGEVRPHVNIFVDGESIRYSGGLETPVRDGAEIVIVPALSGG